MDDENHTQISHINSKMPDPATGESQSISKSSRSASPPAQNPHVDGSQVDAMKEAKIITAVNSSSRADANTFLESDKALVDAVTDKIRGESMSLPPDSPTKNPQSFVPKSSNSHSGSDGDSSDKEQSRKRKLSSQSSTANEAAVRLHSKRPKESDVLEREEDSEDAPSTTDTEAGLLKPVQVFGFGSFASAKSPFASGEKDISVATPTNAPGSSVQPATELVDPKEPMQDGPSPSVDLVNAQSSLVSTQLSGGGFASFASSSPFKRSSVTLSSSVIAPPEQRDSLAGPVRRSKSPVGKHQAFGQYSTGVSRFGNLASRKALQDDLSGQHPNDVARGPEEPVEFQNMLKSKGEEVANHSTVKPEILEVAHNTGEEEDFTVFQTRAKLYTQDETFAYKERGTGLLKVNVRRSDGEGARIVMRAEGVLRLLLNMSLYPGLICELGPDPKFIKIAEITAHERRLHAIKVGNAKLAQELYDHLMESTPNSKQTTYPEPAV